MKIYDIEIDMLDCESGLDAISLVENPAVEVDFLKFSKEEKKELQFVDDEKRIITGVALLADTPIYRISPSGEEYYVNFTKETIKKLVEKYFKFGLGNSVNIEHNNSMFCDNVIMTESFLINKDRGICPIEFKDVPDGSWVVSYKVNNNDVWEKIKSGELKGFSVQGIFSLIQEKFEDKHKNKFKMKSLKEMLKNILLQFDGVQTDKGMLTWNGEKQLEPGDEVYLDEKPAPDGDYVADDKVFVVKDGKVEEIRDKDVEDEKPEDKKEDEKLDSDTTETTEDKEDDKDDTIEKLEGRVAELEKTLADLVERVSKIEATPVVEPVVDEFESMNKRLDKTNKYARIFGSK